MLRSVASSAVLVLLTGTAFAADLPVPVEAAPVIDAAPAPLVHDWSGLYAGIQGGPVWGDEDHVNVSTGTAFPYDIDGWKIGGHAGYLMQWNWAVLGIEGDVEYADIEGSRAVAADEITTDFNWQASIRARLGVAFDRLLIYGTGGAAYADIDGSLLNGATATRESFDLSRWGWTAGGGVDFALMQNVSIGAEYRYTDLGDESVTGAAAFPGTVSEWDTTYHVVRGRVSLRWGGAPQP